MTIGNVGMNNIPQPNNSTKEARQIERETKKLQEQLKSVKNDEKTSPDEKVKRVQELEGKIAELQAKRQVIQSGDTKSAPVQADTDTKDVVSFQSAQTTDGKFDVYIPSGDKPEETPGIYHLETDESGKQKIVFDHSEATAKDEEMSEESSDSRDGNGIKEGKDDEETQDKKNLVTRGRRDTSKVEKEIKQLKGKQAELQQQLASARDDEDKKRNIEMQLAQVGAEIQTKDNDAYKKQHAEFIVLSQTYE